MERERERGVGQADKAKECNQPRLLPCPVLPCPAGLFRPLSILSVKTGPVLISGVEGRGGTLSLRSYYLLLLYSFIVSVLSHGRKEREKNREKNTER